MTILCECCKHKPAECEAWFDKRNKMPYLIDSAEIEIKQVCKDCSKLSHL